VGPGLQVHLPLPQPRQELQWTGVTGLAWDCDVEERAVVAPEANLEGTDNLGAVGRAQEGHGQSPHSPLLAVLTDQVSTIPEADDEATARWRA